MVNALALAFHCHSIVDGHNANVCVRSRICCCLGLDYMQHLKCKSHRNTMQTGASTISLSLRAEGGGVVEKSLHTKQFCVFAADVENANIVNRKLYAYFPLRHAGKKKGQPQKKSDIELSAVRRHRD